MAEVRAHRRRTAGDAVTHSRPPACRVSLDWRDTTSLLLAVEVLSPASLRADRVVKRPFYARHKVDEYWVVDLDARIIERTRLGEERPEILDATLEWCPSEAAESLLIDIPRLFASIYGDSDAETS